MASTETEAHREGSVRDFLARAAVARARDLIFEIDEETLALQIELTEIPAPPFGEARRAERVAEHFRRVGLHDVRIDSEGNVVGDFTRVGGAPALILSAHLDTVFPEGTDVSVRRKDGRLSGPGISDDGRGLAGMITIARVLRSSGVELAGGVRFVATVGEEGEGDLRGVRHLFSEEENRRARAFVSLDGAGMRRIVTRGLGVRRLRLTARGPGGHSWVDRSAANPIHALAHAVASMDALDLPGTPPVGLTVARWGGGSSINAVPREAWVDLDLRSESGNHLREVEDRVRRLTSGAVASVNARSQRNGRLSLDVRVLGDRPPGSTDPDGALVEAAIDASRALGQEPELTASSTDSNIPMSLGIPAITMGCGGEAGNAHTPDEWFRNHRGPEGIFRALLTVALAVDLDTAGS